VRDDRKARRGCWCTRRALKPPFAAIRGHVSAAPPPRASAAVALALAVRSCAHTAGRAGSSSARADFESAGSSRRSNDATRRRARARDAQAHFLLGVMLLRDRVAEGEAELARAVGSIPRRRCSRPTASRCAPEALERR
jgi:hypothetical protein